MNSQQFKKQYKNAYQEFFGSHEIVYSVPLTIPLRYDNSDYQSGLRIIQKIPLRAYIGIRYNNSDKASFGDITYFDYCQRKFLSQSVLQYKNQFGLLLERDYHRNNKHQGIQFSFFIETQKNSSFSITKVLLLLLDYWEVYGSEDHTIRSSKSLYATQKDLLTKIRKHESISHNITSYQTDSLLQLASYSYGSFPFIGLNNNLNNQRALNDFFEDLPEVPSTTFDYTIIYSGIPAFTMKNKKEFKMSPLVKEKLESLYKNALPLHQSMLYKNLIENKDIDSHIKKLRSEYALQFLDCAHRIFNPLYSEQESQNFLYLIQKKRLMDQLVNELSGELSSYTRHIKSFFVPYQNSTTWYRINPKNSDGSIMFITPIERFRKIIDHHIDLKDPGLQDNSYVIYKSREDGIEEKGLLIEQDISKGIFSDYVRSGYIKVSNEAKHIKKGSELDMKKYPMVLDMIKKKIFIYGNTINSKDLPSQSYTAELLYLLINTMGDAIENSDLPLGAYSKNKNEMVGKIIVPLKKIVQKYFSIDFPIHCHGKGTTFSVSLDKDPIDISIIEEVI